MISPPAPGLTSLAAAELLTLARQGALRPLPLPRGNPWDEARCGDFLDSLARGHPAGALVLARGAAGAGRVRLGRWSSDAPACHEAFWVIDGQRRIGALAEALRDPDPEGDPGLALDLASGALSRSPPFDDPQGELPGLSSARSMPLAAALDPAALLRWLRLHPQDEAAVQRVLAASERLRTYRFPVYLVRMEDLDMVGEVFERANGERLDAVARFCLRQGLGEAATSLSRSAAALLGLGFGPVEEEVVLRVLRALAAAAGHEPDREAMPGLLRQSEAALRRAIVFLQVNGGIGHGALLPYAPPLAVLARFFHEFPRPQAATRELLRRWLWRGSLSLSLGASFDRPMHAIVPGDEAGSATRLLALAPDAPSPEILRLDRFRAAHARGRLQLCALASLRPRSIDSAEVDLPALFASDPSPPLLIENTSSPLAASAANRWLHPRAPGLLRSLLTAPPEVLASHAIPPAAVAALHQGDPDAFLAARAAALRGLLERYFPRQAEWGIVDPSATLTDRLDGRPRLVNLVAHERP